MKRLLTPFFILLVVNFMQSQIRYALIPDPISAHFSNTSFSIDENLEIIERGNDKLEKEIDVYNTYLAKYPFKFTRKNSKTKILVEKITSKNKDEYELGTNVTSQSIHIRYSTPASKFYAIQTLIQILKQTENKKLWGFQINDYPKFDYRGMHLDVARHFFTVEEVKNYLDYLAMYKYNKFHWHLTDDQGWRIEIKKYPKLTSIGGIRSGSQVGHYADMKFDSIPYGGFYTQNQIREVVAYAKKLHIDVIPEIEMPGHAQAALAAYPELACTKGSFEVWKQWGVSENIFCPTEQTFTFLEQVLTEVVGLFPYEYIHIGGDEAPKTVWKESQFVQNLMKEKGFKNEMEVQSYFIKRIEKFLNSKGKQIIGWDEILEGGLAPNATVMSWTGIEGGIHAAKSHHKAIMTPTSANYFDYYQGNPETEPISIGGDLRLKKVYQYQPIPKDLDEKEAKYIWGTQGNLWTEYILNFPHVQHMIFPRMLALSEVAWGTSKPDLYKDFENRVLIHFKDLDRQGIRYSKAIFEVSDHVSKNSDGSLNYELSAANDPQNIHYTLDGTDPTTNSPPYQKSLRLDKSTLVKSAYFEDGSRKSPITTREFHFSKSTGKPITLEFEPNAAYNTGGGFSLVDGIFGDFKNHGKSWLGFSGTDLNATIDLETNQEFNTIILNTLERQGSWIYFPNRVEIQTSSDTKNFKTIKIVEANEIQKSKGKLKINLPKTQARFVKIKVSNFGTIPKGMPGAENKAWLFVDEIAIENNENQ